MEKHHNSLLNTVAVSLAISSLSFLVAAFNLYYTVLRSPHVSATLTLVAVSSRSGRHIIVPTSISNSGAQPATVLNAKLIESSGERQSLWGAEFATTIASAIDAINGKAQTETSLFVPFLIPPAEQVQTALFFVPSPTQGFSTELLARSGKTLRYTLILSTTAGDVTVNRNVTWPGVTNGALEKAAFGVAAATDDVDRWFDATTPSPATSP